MLELRTHWPAGRYQLLYSDYLLTEVRRAWGSAYWTSRVPSEASHEFFGLMSWRAKWIDPHLEVVGVASHAGDDPVLATAASAQADCLITGDADLLRLGVYEDVRIITARQFVELLDRR